MEREGRDQAICRMYREGRTMDALAEAYGVSRQRIHQILARHGVHRARTHLVLTDTMRVQRQAGWSIARIAHEASVTQSRLQYAFSHDGTPPDPAAHFHAQGYRRPVDLYEETGYHLPLLCAAYRAIAFVLDYPPVHQGRNTWYHPTVVAKVRDWMAHMNKHGTPAPPEVRRAAR